jgi:hypothetical protein
MVEALCAVASCTDAVFCRDFCYLHYHRWWRLGDPEAPLTRNSPKASLADKFNSFVRKGQPGECWLWTGWPGGGGYGYLRVNGKKIGAHRVAYELFIGPIPEGLHLDHKCHTEDASCPGGRTCPHRLCVNPEHLEATTQRINNLRGRSFAAQNAVKTHCSKGHPFDAANTYTYPDGSGRDCRRCTADRQLAYKRRVQARNRLE